MPNRIYIANGEPWEVSEDRLEQFKKDYPKAKLKNSLVDWNPLAYANAPSVNVTKGKLTLPEEVIEDSATPPYLGLSGEESFDIKTQKRVPTIGQATEINTSKNKNIIKNLNTYNYDKEKGTYKLVGNYNEVFNQDEESAKPILDELFRDSGLKFEESFSATDQASFKSFNILKVTIPGIKEYVELQVGTEDPKDWAENIASLKKFTNKYNQYLNEPNLLSAGKKYKVWVENNPNIKRAEERLSEDILYNPNLFKPRTEVVVIGGGGPDGDQRQSFSKEVLPHQEELAKANALIKSKNKNLPANEVSSMAQAIVRNNLYQAAITEAKYAEREKAISKGVMTQGEMYAGATLFTEDMAPKYNEVTKKLTIALEKSSDYLQFNKTLDDGLYGQDKQDYVRSLAKDNNIFYDPNSPVVTLEDGQTVPKSFVDAVNQLRTVFTAKEIEVQSLAEEQADLIANLSDLNLTFEAASKNYDLLEKYTVSMAVGGADIVAGAGYLAASILTLGQSEDLKKLGVNYALAGQELRNSFVRDVSFDDAFTEYNFGKFAAQEISNQIPIIAALVLSGGTAAPYVIGAATSGGKMMDMQAEIATGQATYSPTEVWAKSLGYGIAEGVFSAITTVPILKRTSQALNNAGKTQLLKSNMRYYFQSYNKRGLVIDPLLEAAGEMGTTGAQNLIDGKHFTENMDHSGFSGLGMGLIFAAVPFFKGMYNSKFTNYEKLSEARTLQEEVDGLGKRLISTKSDKVRIKLSGIIEEKSNQIADIIKKQEVLINNNLTERGAKYVFDIIDKQISLQNKAKALIDDVDLPKDIKKKQLAVLQENFNLLTAIRDMAVSESSYLKNDTEFTAFEAVDKVKYDEYMEQASRELSDEKGGKESSEIDIKNRAYNLYFGEQVRVENSKQESGEGVFIGKDFKSFDTIAQAIEFIDSIKYLEDSEKQVIKEKISSGADGAAVEKIGKLKPITIAVVENQVANQRKFTRTHEVGHQAFWEIFTDGKNSTAFDQISKQLLHTIKAIDGKVYQDLLKDSIYDGDNNIDPQEVIMKVLEYAAEGKISSMQKAKGIAGIFGVMVQKKFGPDYDFNFKGEQDIFNFVLGIGRKIKAGKLSVEDIKAARGSALVQGLILEKVSETIQPVDQEKAFSTANRKDTINGIEDEIKALYNRFSSGMDENDFEDKLKELEDRLEQAEKIGTENIAEPVKKKETITPKKEEVKVKAPKKSNLQSLFESNESNGTKMVNSTLTKTPGGKPTAELQKSVLGQELAGLVETITRRLYDGIPADAKRGVDRAEYKDALISAAAVLISKEYNPEKQKLDAFISSRLNLRANALAKELGIESASTVGGKGIALGLDEAKDIIADNKVTNTADKPKFKTLLEAKIISSEAMSTVTNKILTFVRTLKSRIDAPVSLNKTVTPLISEIRDAAGKMIDIDLKTEMGGKKDRVLEKWLLKHKKAALENMTTTWLMGKDMGTRVDGGMPIAIQKRINGEWLNYPAWIGKKVDRESTSTDLAGRTSGSDLVRRLPNVNNSISDADFLATIIGEDGNPIRGRKESFAKAVAEELAFDVINNDLANGGVISEALAVNQERNGYERANNMIADVLRQSERGNIKFSIASNLGMLDDVLKSNIEKKLITLLDFYSPEQKLFAQEFIDGRRVRKTKDKQRNAVIDELRVYNEVIGKHVSTKIKTGAQEWSSIEHEERLSILIAKNKNNRAGLLKAISSLIASEVKSYNSSAGNVITKNIEYFYYILKPALIANGQKDLLDDGHISIKQWEVKGKTRTAILINNKKIETPFAIINSKYKISKGEEFAELGKKEWDADADTAAAYFIGEYNKFKGEGFTDESLLKFTNFLELIKNDMLGILHKMSKMGMYVTGLTATDTRPEHNTPVAEIKKKFIEIARKNGSDEDILAFLKEECRVNFIPVVVDKILSKTGAKFTALNRYSEKRMHNLEVVEALMEYEGRLNDIADAYGSQKIWNELVSEVKYLHSIGMTGKQLNEAWDKAAASRAFSSAPKGISVFDFDDTVAYTKGTVLYTMPDETTGILNAEEFAKEGGALFTDGATFDFSNFDVVTDGKPGPMAQRMKDLIDKFGAKDVFILTARNPNAAEPIHQFLESIGINIPIENITGLGNSNAKAKADWMVGKVAEGYNDFYFSDDAIQNVKAVADVLSQYDIKSDVVQAKIKFSLNMSDNFNKILEESAGIESYKKYSDIVAKRRGAAKGKYRFFIPPSAEDFTGLLYDFLGRGKQGEDHMDFFNQALIEPYTKGVALIESAKRKAKNDFKAVMDAHKTVAKKLGSLTPEGDFTYDQAIRVFMWTQGGQEIPGISKRDAKKLNDLVESDPELLDFSKSLVTIGKQDNVWVKPGEYWDTETIISDLNNITEKGGRKKFLEEFITNADEIFSKENLNKIEANFGTNFRSALEDSLFRMKSGKNRSAGMTANEIRWNDWVNNSTGAIMFFNTRSAILQLISSINFLNWSDNNPAMAAMAFANQPQYWKDFSTIFNSDKLKERRAGLKSDVNEAEIANAAAGAKNKAKAILAYLLKIGFTPTQIADSFAISSGGATFYRNRINTYIKNGLTKEEAENKAWEDFSKISDSTQQSGDPMLISQQQASSIGRLILAFVNTPLQYNRLIKKAARDLQNKRGDVKTNISKIIYYGALQNLIFSGLQTALFALAFDDDDEEDKREKLDKKSAMILNGMLDTILKGSGMAGAVVATIKNTAMKYMDQEDKGFKADYAYVLIEAANVSPPIGSKFRKLYSGMKNRQFEKEVIAERGFSAMVDGKLNISPAWNVVGKVVEATTNLPMDRLLSKVNNVAEGLDSRNASWQRIALLLGWSPRNVNVVNEENDLIKAGAKVANKKAGIEKGKATRAAATQAKKDSISSLTGKAKEDYERMLLDKKEATKLKRKLKSEKKKDSISNLSPEDLIEYEFEKAKAKLEAKQKKQIK